MLYQSLKKHAFIRKYCLNEVHMDSPGHRQYHGLFLGVKHPGEQPVASDWIYAYSEKL